MQPQQEAHARRPSFMAWWKLFMNPRGISGLVLFVCCCTWLDASSAHSQSVAKW
jgi:hypothetical protein